MADDEEINMPTPLDVRPKSMLYAQTNQPPKPRNGFVNPTFLNQESKLPVNPYNLDSPCLCHEISCSNPGNAPTSCKTRDCEDPSNRLNRDTAHQHTSTRSPQREQYDSLPGTIRQRARETYEPALNTLTGGASVDDAVRELQTLSLADDSAVGCSSVPIETAVSVTHSGDVIEYIHYTSERQMPDIMKLITDDLSEPYSVYTYRYFIHNWPQLCFLATVNGSCIGSIVCKLDYHKQMVRRGYIAMLAVHRDYRRNGIASVLVRRAIAAMVGRGCDEVVLETEVTNQGALRLYENLGFVRDKRLFRYYLNGVDALRLKLWLR